MKKTVIEQIEIKPETGFVFIRMQKRLMDGDRIIGSEYHRTALEPDSDVDVQAKAVNDHLVLLGEEPVPLEEWDAVKACAKIARTPAIMKAWNKQKEARLAEEKIRQKKARDDAAQLDRAVAAAVERSK